MELFGDFDADECHRFFPWIATGIERLQLPWDSTEVLHNTIPAHVPTMAFVTPELLESQHHGLVQYGYIPISALQGSGLGDPKQALPPNAVPYIISGGPVPMYISEAIDDKQNMENPLPEGQEGMMKQTNPAMLPVQFLYPPQFPLSQVIGIPNPGILTSYGNSAATGVAHMYSMIPTMYNTYTVPPSSQPNEEIAKVPRPPVEGAADNEVNVCSIPPTGLIVENVALAELKTRVESDSSRVKAFAPPNTSLKITKDIPLANPKSFSPISKIDSNCIEQHPLGNINSNGSVIFMNSCNANPPPNNAMLTQVTDSAMKRPLENQSYTDSKDIDYDALEEVDYDDEETNVCTTKIYTSSAFEHTSRTQHHQEEDLEEEEDDGCLYQQDEEDEIPENEVPDDGDEFEQPEESVPLDPEPEIVETLEDEDVMNEPTPPPPVNKPSSWAALFKSNNNTSNSGPVVQQSVTNRPRPVVVSATVQPPVGDAPMTPAAYNGQHVVGPSPINGTSSSSAPGKGAPRISYEMPVKPQEDEYAMFLGKFFSNLRVKNNQVALQPRGLVNRGNWCYINSILQALLACPPFFQLVRNIPIKVYKERGPSCTPTVDCFHRLAIEFNMMPLANRRDRVKDSELLVGSDYEPVDVYKMLQKIRSHLSVEGRQEDAEEFLNCVLDGMHEEMASVIRFYSAASAVDVTNVIDTHTMVGDPTLTPAETNTGGDGDGEWEQVGPKNKFSVTRSTEIKKTPISDIFSGELRSVVSTTGSRDSATLQPFFTLPLDIQSEKVQYIDDALENLFMKEAIHGFTNSNTKTEVEASRRYTIEKLPQVMILHLKRFIYDKTGCQKNSKEVRFNIELEMNPNALSNSLRKLNKKQRSYKLFAIVYHVGKNAVGGHYVTDYFHPILSAWVKADDNKIMMPISIPKLMKFNQTQVPYILFYRRADLV